MAPRFPATRALDRPDAEHARKKFFQVMRGTLGPVALGPVALCLALAGCSDGRGAD